MQANLAVFISGFGSNLEVFLQHKQKFNSIIVVSSNPKAYGLERANSHGVESLVLPKPIDWKDLQIRLEENQIDKIFCAGFMKIIPAEFIESWQGRIFNLHPSLLPNYKGLKAIERAFDAKAPIGVSIHHLTAEVDAGEVILQEVILEPRDYLELSLEQVKQKVQSLEHQLVARWINQN